MASTPTGSHWAPGLPMASNFLGNEGFVGGQAATGAEPGAGRGRGGLSSDAWAGPAPSKDLERLHCPQESPNSLAFEEIRTGL